MARTNSNRALCTVDRIAAAAVKAAMAKLSQLSDEQLAEIEDKFLNVACLYADRDESYEDWKHVAHYQVVNYAWVMVVLAAVAELRQRRQRERIRELERELASA
jgi:hypothetical protein